MPRRRNKNRKNNRNKKQSSSDKLLHYLRKVMAKTKKGFIVPTESRTAEGVFSPCKEMISNIHGELLAQARSLVSELLPDEYKDFNNIIVPMLYGLGNCGEHAFFGLYQLLCSKSGYNGNLKQIIPVGFCEEKKDYDHSHAFLLVSDFMLHNRRHRNNQENYIDSEWGERFGRKEGEDGKGTVAGFIEALIQIKKTRKNSKHNLFIVDPYWGLVCRVDDIPAWWMEWYTCDKRKGMRLTRDFFHSLVPINVLRERFEGKKGRGKAKANLAIWKLHNRPEFEQRHKVLLAFSSDLAACYNSLASFERASFERALLQTPLPNLQSQVDGFVGFSVVLVALRKKVAGHYGSSAPSIAVHSKAAPSKAVLHEIALLRTAPSSVNKSKRPEAVLRKAAPTPTPAALPSTPLQTAPSSVNKSKRRCDQGVVSTAVRLFVMSAIFSSCCYYSNSNLESDVPSGSVILRLLLSLFIAATVTTFVDHNTEACRDEIGKILGM